MEHLVTSWGNHLLDLPLFILGIVVSYGGIQVYHSFLVLHIGLWVFMMGLIVVFVKYTDYIMGTSETKNMIEIIRPD